MKQIAKLLVFVMLFNYIFSIVNVFAIEKTPVIECDASEYTLGYANSDKTITTKACFNTFKEAKDIMTINEEANNENLVILNGIKKIVDAKYGLITLDVNKNENTAFYYNSNTIGNYFAVNGYGYYNGGDMALINILDNMTAYVKISGEKAYLKENTYQVVPLALIKSNSFYQITNDEIKHCLTNNIESVVNKYNNCIVLGKKPKNIPVGEYFSYDGNYFYKDLITMLKDYKANNFNNAINANNPYYNYYLYLSHRTKTTYSSITIDEYFRKIVSPNIVGKTYGRKDRTGYSMFYGEGYSFYEAQERNGANALMILSVARNEAGPYGNSQIAMGKNNIFGHKAYDGDAYNKATTYVNIKEGILIHASDYISYGYADPNDTRYKGVNFGNKKNGMNVFYATDPYWGEKAASNYYKFDKASGFNDLDYYQIAVSNTGGINYKRSPNNNSKTVYTTKITDISITIVEEVVGESINGNNIWYKMLSDLLIDENYNTADNPNYVVPAYNWTNSYVYVHSSQFNKANIPIKANNNPNDVYKYDDYGYKYQTYSKDGKLNPLVAKLKNNAKTYYESSLTNVNNVTLLKDKLVTVFEACFDKDGKVKSYLVATDNYLNQRHWVAASDLEFVNYDFVKIKMNEVDYYYDMYKDPSYNNRLVGSGTHTDNYLVIVDSVMINNKMWLKVQYSLTDNTNSYLWMESSYGEGSLEYTINYPHEKPVITATNKEVLLDKVFNPLDGVSATDKEDGNLTSKIKVIKNNVNTSLNGSYEVVYEVSDSSGKVTTKIIKVNVTGVREVEGLFYFDSLKSTTDNKLLISGFLGNKGMDNKEGLIHTIILKNVDNSKEYKFTMNNWRENVPFDMTNIGDDKPYNYSGGWFKSEIDMANVLPGEYIIYIEVLNGVNKSSRLFNNLGLKDMTRKYEGSNKSYTISTNYYEKTLPISIIIRNDKLIATSIPSTLDLMYNFFNELTFSKNNLNILGTSHNVGIDYGKNVDVKRELIFENKETFERITNNIGYIDNGPYKVELRVPDLKDKTRVWFNNSVDISNLKVGEYIIYLKTTVGSFSDYGELSDIGYNDKELNQKTVINNKEYSFRRVDNKRFRVELIVKSV